MNNLPTDQTKATLSEWSTALIAAFSKAGCGVNFHPIEKGAHRLAEMYVTPKHNPRELRYKIEFARKLIVRGGERYIICTVEVYNPIGGLHVHMRTFSAAKVAKIVAYAMQYIAQKTSNEERVEAKRSRAEKARLIFQRELSGTIPIWASVLANTDTDADLGTFTLSFHEHRETYPMNRLTPATLKVIIQSIEGILAGGVAPGWQPVSVPVPPELVNDPNSVTGFTKMLLLAIPDMGYKTAPRGWFYGGVLNEFRVEGSPNAQKPTHWMPLPSLP